MGVGQTRAAPVHQRSCTRLVSQQRQAKTPEPQAQSSWRMRRWAWNNTTAAHTSRPTPQPADRYDTA
eukprot:10971044-Alexandrium_andersonii.AAC.1